MIQQMTDCRKCGSKYCYETIEEGKFAAWKCLMCGFETSTYMMKNTTETNSALDVLPKLYRELQYVDEDGFVWVPTFFVKEGVGEVYASITKDGNAWAWFAAQHVSVLDSEKEMYKNEDGSYKQYKADRDNAVAFHKDAFPGALHYLGIL